MLNRKFFPFERNNYYFGKLLTARDFESEQKYMNDKRRFLNRLVDSWGIVSGLNIVPADDTSVVLQSGCAIDAGGREIVVPETQVIKLSTIDGYQDIESGIAYLGIKYDEAGSDEVYAAISEESSSTTKFNKSREGFKLFIEDEMMVNKIADPIDEFITETQIYSDDSFVVTQYTPKFATAKEDLSVKVVIKKITNNKTVCSLFYNIEPSGFVIKDSAISVSANNIQLLQNETYELNVVLKPEKYIFNGNTTALLNITNITFQKDNEEFPINNQIQISVKPVRGNLVDYLISNYYKKAMDKMIDDSYEEKVWLAKLNIIKSDKQCVISEVSDVPFSQYVYNTQQLMLLNKLKEYYPDYSVKDISAGKASEINQVKSISQKYDLSKYTSCGVQEIPIGLGYELRQPVFSDEIMHGLGKGPVYVDLGIEYVTSDGSSKTETSEVFLGDASMFAKHNESNKEERLYNITTAVKILPDRGTFIIGVCPYETTDVISVRVRWYAFKVSELNKQVTSSNNGAKCILLNPDTIVLPPKGTAHITPVFVNMEAETCSYKLIDIDGGSIDNNGVYTAPAKEGVYEIRVECISDPSVFVHAFAIVSQKKATEQKEEQKID